MKNNNIWKYFNIYFADRDAADKFSEELRAFVNDMDIPSDKSYKEMVDEKINQMIKDHKYSFGTYDTHESMIRIDISDTYYRTYVSYHIEVNKNEAEEDPDTKLLIKSALIAGGLVLLGIIIGKKTGRYKRWNGKYSIEKPFGMDDDDVSAINWFANKQNEAWVKNHLVLVIDKRYKKPSGYRRK